MSFLFRKNKGRPAYLDAPMQEYMPRYANLQEALDREIPLGGFDVKRLIVTSPKESFSVYYANGMILHVYRENNVFNLMERANYSLNDEEYNKLREVQGETAEINGGLKFTQVAEINPLEAHTIFSDLALRWAMLLDEALRENPNETRYHSEIIENITLANEIKNWNFLAANPSELHILMESYRESKAEKTNSILANAGTLECNLSLHMGEEEYSAFWENADAAEKLILQSAREGRKLSAILGEETSVREDNVIMALEALAFEEKVLVNGESLFSTEEDALPPLEEFSVYTQRGDSQSGKAELAEEAAKLIKSSPISSPEEPHFLDLSDDMESDIFAGDMEGSGEDAQLDFHATPLGELKVAPLFTKAEAMGAFPGDPSNLRKTFSKIDDLSNSLLEAELDLSSMSNNYANNSKTYNNMATQYELSAMEIGEDAPQEPKNEAVEEAQDTANGVFFALEFMEQRRKDINSQRLTLLGEAISSLRELGHGEYADLLSQICQQLQWGAATTKNIALVNEASTQEMHDEIMELEKLNSENLEGGESNGR